MLTEKDIYAHLANGGDPDELYVALNNEIALAKEKIKAEEDARKQAEEKKIKVAELRSNAVAALTEYFALVNPDVNRDVINEVLDILGRAKVEASVNPFSIFTTFGL